MQKHSAFLSVFSVTLWLIRIAFAFAVSADCSRITAAAMPILARGGRTRANRCTQRHQPSESPCNYANSAAIGELPARHFSGNIAEFATNIA